jgi:hypothetical protein
VHQTILPLASVLLFNQHYLSRSISRSFHVGLMSSLPVQHFTIPTLADRPPPRPDDLERSIQERDNGSENESNGKKKREKGVKRRKVNHACLYCRRSHMTCDEGEPALSLSSFRGGLTCDFISFRSPMSKVVSFTF